jgi:UDP-glucose 4-epimerase
MKVLISGGAGFIGSHLVEYYQNRAEEIRVIDDLSTGSRSNLKGFGYRWIEGCITSEETVKRAVQGIDIVVHLGALISVPESIREPIAYNRVNVEGTLKLLEAAVQAGVRKFVVASSAAVYGNNPTIPKTEGMAPEPGSPYAVTKLDCEYYCKIYQENTPIETAALRFFNVFGPRQDPKSAYAAAVPAFIERALKNEPITIYGDGQQTRDFVYVKDLVEVLALAAETPEIRGVYNVGYGEQTTIINIAEQIVKCAKSSSHIRHEAARAGDVRHSRASVEKLLATGWKPSYNIERGLQETLDYYHNALQ